MRSDWNLIISSSEILYTYTNSYYTETESDKLLHS